jgi:flagellar protein FlaG
MNVESINISQKSLAPGTQKRLPADQKINLKEENAEKPVKEPDSSHVKELLSDVRNRLNNVELHFSVHEPSGKIVVTVTEKSSGKVIREIPSSEILQIVAKMDEMVGVIFDKNV